MVALIEKPPIAKARTFEKGVNRRAHLRVRPIPGKTRAQSEAALGLTDLRLRKRVRLTKFNRWYDPNVGRWVSEDPVGFDAGDSNLYRYLGNSTTLFSDASGLQIDSVSSSITKGAGSGNIALLESLIKSGGLSAAQKAAAEAAIARLKSTATQVIAKECQGKIWRVFPRELKDKTIKEIIDLSKGSGPLKDKAQTALKLLNNSKYKKH